MKTRECYEQHTQCNGTECRFTGRTKPIVGQLVTVYGQACRIFKIRPCGTIDVVTLDGERAYRLSGLRTPANGPHRRTQWQRIRATK